MDGKKDLSNVSFPLTRQWCCSGVVTKSGNEYMFAAPRDGTCVPSLHMYGRIIFFAVTMRLFVIYLVYNSLKTLCVFIKIETRTSRGHQTYRRFVKVRHAVFFCIVIAHVPSIYLITCHRTDSGLVLSQFWEC